MPILQPGLSNTERLEAGDSLTVMPLGNGQIALTARNVAGGTVRQTQAATSAVVVVGPFDQTTNVSMTATSGMVSYGVVQSVASDMFTITTTATMITSPTPQMLTDTTSFYVVPGSPPLRYQSTGSTMALVSAGGGSGSSLPITTTFAQAIPFDAYRSMGQLTVSGALTFTKNLTGSTVGGETVVTLVADGVNTPNFSAFTLLGGTAYDNTAGRVNLISFFRDASGYYYGVGLGALVDTVAPLESTATVESVDPLVTNVLFDEDLDHAAPPPDASTFAFSAGHAAVSTAWGAGNRTVAVTHSTAFVFGEAARTLAYTRNGTRNLKDLAGNEVANFTGKAITNNVAAVDATAPTLVSAIVQNATPSQVDLVFSEAMNATWSASSAFTITGHTILSITRLTGTTGYLTLSAAFVNGEAARTGAYTQPGSNKMQDLAGNLLANITAAAITNNVAAAGGRVDNFTRADSTTAIGAPSDGGAAWTVTGLFGIVGNAAYVPDTAATGVLQVAVLAGASPITAASVDLIDPKTGHYAEPAPALIFGYVDSSNYYSFNIRGNGTAFLQKVVAGVNSDLFQTEPALVTLPGTNTLSVTKNNTTGAIVAKVNGTTLISVTDNTHTTGTKAGVAVITDAGGRTDGITFDNFSAT